MLCGESLQKGGAMIVDPQGKVVSRPLVDEEGIIYGNADPLLAVAERQNLDIS